MKPCRDHILFKFFSQSVLVSFFLFHSYFILVFVLGVEPHCWVEQLDGQENKSRQSFTGPPFILINSFYITDNDRYCFEYVGRLCRTNMLSECLVPKKFLFRNKFGQRHCGWSFASAWCRTWVWTLPMNISPNIVLTRETRKVALRLGKVGRSHPRNIFQKHIVVKRS